MHHRHVFILFAFAACGGSVASSTTVPSVDLQHFSSTAASTFCHALQTCCSVKQVTYNDAACVGQVTTYFENLAAPAKTSTKVAFDATAAGKCIQEIEDREKQCESDFASLTGPIDVKRPASACDSVFKGTVQPGQPCASAAECAPDSDPSIKSVVRCENHVCNRFSDVHATGESCEVSNFEVKQCKNGLSCAASPSKTCPDFTPIGGSCAGNNLCDGSTAYCDGKSCQALPSVGEKCGKTGECLYGLYCAAGTCKASNTGTGSACSDGYNACPLGQICSQGGVCVVDNGAIGTVAPTHLYDIAPRSCTLGPFAEALDDGKGP